jgi:hypothetical protein
VTYGSTGPTDQRLPAPPAGGGRNCRREPSGGRHRRHDLVGHAASTGAESGAGRASAAKYEIRRSGTEAATAGAEAAGAGAEAGSNRSQRRADPDPLGAARARPGEQDRQLRSRVAGLSGEQRGAARRNLRPAAPRQHRPLRSGGDRPAAHAAAADRSQRHDAHGRLLSIGSCCAAPRTRWSHRPLRRGDRPCCPIQP